MSDLNEKIAELKKRIFLVEGQKIAKTTEWQKQNRINCDTIAALKKEIKELLHKYTELRNPLQRPVVIRDSSNADRSKLQSASSATTVIQVGKASYPIGAKTPDEALFLTDLKLTEHRKQMDLVRHRLKGRKERYVKLAREYQELLACTERQQQQQQQRSQLLDEKPPETLEEATNRRLVCRLENEIHRTNVQWLEAEHVRKKYRSILASLLSDAERFERSLQEREESLREQQMEINRLTEVHNEAVEMRDAAKLILHRQEQQTHSAQKLRERQALDYRRQVEIRKLELERIGSKLFLEGKTSDNLTHRHSIVSATEEIENGNSREATLRDSNTQLHNETTEMDHLFRMLMELTGATTPHKVLERFSSQKESAMRLNYLRAAAEAEKHQLEAQRAQLSTELEASKFSEVRENEVNEEVIEKIKSSIADLEEERQRNVQAAGKSAAVLKHLHERLHEMIYKLQEVDESEIVLQRRSLVIESENLPHFLVDEASDEDLIEVLQIKLQRSEELRKEQMQPPSLEKLPNKADNIAFAKLNERLKSPVAPERPASMPTCYFNLMAGRAQRATGTLSSSPEQAAAAAAATDGEETEVPSRNYLKRQSALVVESKSRRKPLRTALTTLRR